MKQHFLTTILVSFINLPLLLSQQVDNVILITLDGLRWQEVYGGAVDSLIDDESFTKDKDDIAARFRGHTKEISREKLMPWFWSTLVNQGQLYGNRWAGNQMTCTNRFWFSYPGYSEILTGFSDPTIDSNAKEYNENVTVLEWINQHEEFNGHVAAFASWDVFPFIINDKRSGIPVNAGFQKAEDEYLTYKELLLNDLQDEIPSPWSTVRLDAFTHHYMLEYMKKHRPRVVYIAYGETDDFAHDGRYDHYLKSANQTDQWIKELWEYVQTDPFYKDKTSLVITTDHGRGTIPAGEWTSHGNTIKGANEIWAAAIGPNVPAKGIMKNSKLLFQSQIAKTVAAMLGYQYEHGDDEVGDVIESMISR